MTEEWLRAQWTAAPLGLTASAQSDGELAGEPLMSSIDAAIVKQVFGSDTALFESLATRLLREYADLAVPHFDMAADALSNRYELQQRVHKLKGSAGMIGASTVSALAGAAEAALQKDRPVDGIMAKLGCALIILRNEFQRLLECRPDQVPQQFDTAGRSSSLSSVEIQDLYELLKGQNLAALAKCSELAEDLMGCLGAVEFERLRASIDRLDFSGAAQFLLDARQGADDDKRIVVL